MDKKKKRKVVHKVWTIANVAPEVKVAALKAATKNQQFVGEWVSIIVMEAAQKVLKDKQEVMRQEDHVDLNQIFKQILEIKQDVDQMKNQKQGLLARVLGR